MTKSAIFSKITAIFLSILTIFSFSAIGASAATSGGYRSSTIYVNTKANYLYPGASSVTLKQSKQTITYEKLGGTKTKTKTDYYGKYSIKVYNVTKNKTTNMSWNAKQTKKISLDPNCQYRITVSYDSNATDVLTRNPPLGYSWKSTSAPSWWVSSTWKLSSCS